MPEGQPWMSNDGPAPQQDGAQGTESAGSAGKGEFEPNDPERIGVQVATETSYHVLNDPVIYPVIALGVVLTTVMPVLLGQRFCLPLLNGLVIFPFLAWALRVGRPRRAVGLVLFWIVVQSVATVAVSLLLTERAGLAILGALEFRTQWLAWIDHGTPVLAWLPQLRELIIYALAAFLTGGLAALILLAMVLNTFNFTVASLIQQAVSPVLLLLIAYPIWMVVRLLGYVILAVFLAEPVAVLDLRPAWWSAWWPQRRRLLGIGLALILAGVVLQLLLSPVWQRLLGLATGAG